LAPDARLRAVVVAMGYKIVSPSDSSNTRLTAFDLTAFDLTA
jgi:hypothetical protein